ncbi:MAG: XrtA/PEP-CTERM system TPR-repeat protein PrsT [Burkholderiales bacterium]
MTDRKNLYRKLVLGISVAVLAACGGKDPAQFVASAESYLAKSDYAAATIELKNALAKSPDDAKARFLLGRVLLEQGDPAGATTELRKALALKYAADDVFPLLARAWLIQGAPKSGWDEMAGAPVTSVRAKAEMAAALAQAQFGAKEFVDAMARSDAALALDPGNVQANLVRARILARNGNPGGALDQVNGLLATTPNDVDVLMLKADLELRLGKRDDSTRTLERVVELRPNAYFAHYRLVNAYINKDTDRAAREAEVMHKLAPGDPRTQHAIAMVAFQRRDYDGALAAIQKSLQVAPNFKAALYLSALIDLKRGSYSAAEQSLRSVIAEAPDDAAAQIALAQTLLMRGQAAKARDTLRPVLNAMPDEAGALRLAAEIELALGKSEAAVGFIERANALEDGNLQGKVRLAQAQVAKGDNAQGIGALQKLAAAEPAKDEPTLALVQTYVRARDYDKALAATDELLKKNPKSVAAFNARGAIFGAKGDLRSAREAFEKAIALEPDNITTLFNLANLDAIERRFPESIKRYDQILAKDPKSERALIGIAQVKMVSDAPQADVVAALQRAVNANPNSPAARQALITYLAMRKDWKAAIAAAQAAQAAVPDVPAILEALGSVQIAGGEKNQAIETYTRLGKLQPDSPIPWTRIAAIHASMKNYDNAIAAAKNAISIAPSNTVLWVATANLYVDAGKVDAGMTEARRLQKDLSTRVAGYGLEAELLAAQKKVPEAIAAYKAAFTRDPTAGVVMRMYSLLNSTGKADEANALAQKFLAEHPKDTQLRVFLGQQALGRGDTKGAAVFLRAASEVDPDNVTILNDLAWSLAETKDTKAVEYAQRAYRIASSNPSVVNTLGWALYQTGDKVQGVQFLRRSVELDPAGQDKRLYLAKALIGTGDKIGARKELEVVEKSGSPKDVAEAQQLLKSL